MSEYIEREAATRTALISDCEDVSLNDVIKVTEEVAEAIKKIPAADVAPVRRGEWEDGYRVVFCSVCGEQSEWRTPYCPMCGAKMK